MKAPLKARTRVLYINHSIDIGGIENLILELIRAQDPAEYEPLVCVFETKGFLEEEFRAAGAQVFVLPKRAGLDPTLPFRLAALIRRSGADLLHTHNQSSWLYAVLANLLTRKPLLHTMHSSCGQDPSRAGRWKRIEWALSLFTDKIVPVARSIADHLVMQQGVSKSRVETIHNGIKTQLFRNPGDAVRTRSRLSMAPGAFVIGNVARLYPIKDQKTLLAAFALFAPKVESARLLLVGEGPLRGPLTELAERLGISSRILFLGNRRDVPELLQIMDLFVLSSLREGFPVSILEAMASGIPVIATRVDGCLEVVTDRENGLLVPPSDPETLSQAMLSCYHNRSQAIAMAAKGKAVVESNFTFDRMVGKYLANYQILVNGGGAL